MPSRKMRFYAVVNGGNDNARACGGSATSGIKAHIRGWDIGCRVELFVISDGDDVMSIGITGGSNHPKELCSLTITEKTLEGLRSGKLYFTIKEVDV